MSKKLMQVRDRKTKQFNFRVSKEEHENLVLLARQHGFTSTGEFIHIRINSYVTNKSQ